MQLARSSDVFFHVGPCCDVRRTASQISFGGSVI